MMESPPNFTSKDEEVKYWKNLAHKMYKEKDEVQQEFSEFMSESKSLEKELEIDLRNLETENNVLVKTKSKLANELDALKEKLEQSNAEIASLHVELSKCRSEARQKATYIRELEQKNDDLERAHRVVRESIVATETTLNQAIERNALLESEMDEKEQLKIKVQRLMDETRDLQQELHVRERLHDSNDKDKALSHSSGISTSSKCNKTLDTQKQKDENMVNVNAVNNNPLHSNTNRIALNILSDIMEKMRLLEAKVEQKNNGRAFDLNNSYRDNLRTPRHLRHRAPSTVSIPSTISKP